jgi:periplasmic copper chaperone A
MRLQRLVVAPFAVLALTLAACGGSSEEISIEETTDDTTLLGDSSEETIVAVTVEDAWARNSPLGAENGEVYMILTSEFDDAVIAADVDITVAAMAEMHESFVKDDGSTGMQMVERIELPAGQAVEFRPGGFHIMLLGLIAPLEAGQIITVTLTLESGELVFVDAEVREDAM